MLVVGLLAVEELAVVVVTPLLAGIAVRAFLSTSWTAAPRRWWSFASNAFIRLVILSFDIPFTG